MVYRISIKIEQLLFYFLFFAIPFQTRKILYSPGWYFNEWQSVSVHATDIVLLVLFGFWALHFFQTLKFPISPDGKAIEDPRQSRDNDQFTNKFQISIFKHFFKPDFYLVLFLIVAGISVKNSSDFYSGFFLWLKFLEFALFYFYLKFYAVRKFNFINILYVLVIGGTFQAIIAIGQFLKQGDLGFRWFGESVIGPNITGVASFFVDSGDKIIRAYGTTPHPNVLAAYLFLAIFVFYFIYIGQNQPDDDGNSTYDTMTYHKLMRVWRVLYSLLIFGLFFTFSRTTIFLWAVGFVAIHAHTLIYGNIKVWREKLMPLFLATLVVVAVFSFFYWPEVLARITLSSEEEAVSLRAFYNEQALKGSIHYFGIGLGDFTNWLMEQNPNLPRHVYQPVHNIYLLIYSEIGVIGFALFILFLARLIYEFIRKTKLSELKHYSFLLVSLSVLFIGLFDHFLITIQQGRFIFWLALTLLSIYDTLGLQDGDGAT